MRRLIPVLVLAALACQWSSSASPSIPTPLPPDIIPTAVAMTFAALATPTSPSSTATATPYSPTPTITSTPAPYEQYTIDYLRQRSYGGGIIEIVRTIEGLDPFTRTLIRYSSDDLTLYGFMNIPAGEGADKGPFPVIIMMHGLGDSGSFNSLNFGSDIVDALTMEGYIVIHPIMRGYPPSDSGDNMFRVGMAIDMLNLIALIKAQAGQAGALEKAMPEHIGILGQSLGGNVALRVLTVSKDVRAAVLYSSLSGNELKNSEQLYKITLEPQFQNELNIFPSLLLGISPMYYYANITAPIQLYQGTTDETVPMSWAEETCSLLSTAGKNINCIYYEGEDHIFSDDIKTQFLENMIGFYRTYLSP
ncbi:MAG: dienelactone hydrolase family protein [Anaerolineae bacterium]|nr:dienelactone hydrolase family protein [Anaerolineae bacterium]MCI0607614.1 dienelactone hydrolase family protein [Anaerolineae bacterium]